MEVIIRPNAVSAAWLTADFIAKEVGVRPEIVLGLATGCTMESVYDRLTKVHLKPGLDFSQCTTFNLDEYVGLPAAHPDSYHFFMRKNFFSKVNLDPRRTHLPDGMAKDLKAECAKYETRIADSGGIDLQLLGIGLNGHLGFNEPPAEFNSRTRVELLSPMTRLQNAPLFSNPDEMPRRAITMGVGTILAARHCLLLATGKDKAEIVARAIEGPLTTLVTASALQLHPHCTVILDEAAAARLKKVPGTERNGALKETYFGNGDGSRPSVVRRQF